MIEDLFESLGPAVAHAMADRRALVTPVFVLDVPDVAVREFAEAVARQVPAGSKRIVLLQDVRTAAAAGELCHAALTAAGLDVHVHTLPDPEGPGAHEPACDDRTQAGLVQGLPAMDMMVGVGSGVISDLAKWVAFERGCPSAAFATAASMNGYTAANVAPSIDGVKTLFSARAHRVLGSSPAILAAAPRRLTTAGLGDVIAKWVSTADWRMNALLFGETFSPAIAGIIDRVEETYLEAPRALANDDAAAVAAVFRALVYSGCAMTLQGSSMPASGGEHLISHALDMRANAEGVPHDLHGRQVGVGTLFVAALYSRIVSLASPEMRATPLPLDRGGWGSLANAVAPHHEKQTARLSAACERLRDPEVWQGLREVLTDMLPPPARIKHVLRAADAAHRIADLGIDRARFSWAVLNGAQMRERFTSLDLGWATGVLPGALDEIADIWLAPASPARVLGV